MKKKFTQLLLMSFVFLGTTTQGFSLEKSNSEKTTINEEKNIPKEVSLWLEKELANSSTQVLKNFEVPEFYTSKNAKIIGYIKDYDKSQGAKTGIFYYTNELTRERKPKVLEIHSDGRFELELPLEYPMLNNFYIENRWVQFYIEPGQYLSVILEMDALKPNRRKKITYQGALKKMNMDLVAYKAKIPHRKIQKMQKEMEALAYRQEVYDFQKQFLEKIKSYELSGEIDAKTKELLENEILLTTYEYMIDYFSISKKIELERKGINMKDLIPEGYFDFIKEMPLNKQSILINNEFGSFVNRLEYSPVLETKTKPVSIVYDDSYVRLLKFIESKNVKLTEEEKELLVNGDKIPSDQSKATEKRKELERFTEKYKGLYDEFLTMIEEGFRKKQEEVFKKSEIKVWQQKDSLARNIGIQNKLVYEIIKSRNLEFNMLRRGESKDTREWWWSYMKENINSPHLHKLGDEFLEKSLNQSKVYKLPASEKGTAVFNKLVSPYKGKVVIVQYWNPGSYYQGKGLESIKKRRSQYKNHKDLVFLDITCEDFSSMEEYNASIKKNDFENTVRITQDEYHYLLQLFDFHGEVKNIVVSPEGKIVRGDHHQGHMLTVFLKENFGILPVVKQ